MYSAFVPGAGQIYAGSRQRGLRLVLVDVVLVVLAGIGVLFFQSEILKAWASLPTLSLIMLGNLVLLSYRAWAAHDAYHLVRGSPEGHTGAIGVALAAVVWLVIPKSTS